MVKHLSIRFLMVTTVYLLSTQYLIVLWLKIVGCVFTIGICNFPIKKRCYRIILLTFYTKFSQWFLKTKFFSGHCPISWVFLKRSTNFTHSRYSISIYMLYIFNWEIQPLSATKWITFPLSLSLYDSKLIVAFLKMYLVDFSASAEKEQHQL